MSAGVGGTGRVKGSWFSGAGIKVSVGKAVVSACVQGELGGDPTVRMVNEMRAVKAKSISIK